jgi:hypothetical protein
MDVDPPPLREPRYFTTSANISSDQSSFAGWRGGGHDDYSNWRSGYDACKFTGNFDGLFLFDKHGVTIGNQVFNLELAKKH